MYRELAEPIVDYLIELNMNPLYFFTIVGIVFSTTYFKYFKTWEEKPWWRKQFAILTFIGTSMMLFFSMLLLFGIVEV